MSRMTSAAEQLEDAYAELDQHLVAAIEAYEDRDLDEFNAQMRQALATSSEIGALLAASTFPPGSRVQ
jgi:hypothetical protein